MADLWLQVRTPCAGASRYPPAGEVCIYSSFLPVALLGPSLPLRWFTRQCIPGALAGACASFTGAGDLAAGRDSAALAPGVLSVIYFCNAKMKGHFALQRMKLQCTFPVKYFEGSDKNLNASFPSSPFV